MNELLSDIVRAHGGFSRWRALNQVEATIVMGGGLRALKGQDLGPRRMTVALHQQRASLKPFCDPDWHTDFTPDRIAICLTTPFLLAREGIQVHEIEPWDEQGETWSILRAEFADSITTHSRVQDFFFGDDLLLRRHDYDVDISCGLAAAELVDDYIMADGIRLPSKRRAYKRRPDRQLDLDSLIVSIDISEVRFS